LRTQPPRTVPPQTLPPQTLPPRALPPRALPPRALAPRALPPRARPRSRQVARGDPVRRLGIALLAIVFVLTLFAGRLVQLQGMQYGSYRALASQERDRTIVLPALRGSIIGADGQVLAMTVATYQVTADPPEIPAAQRQRVAGTLAGPLGLPAAAILGKLDHPTSPQYVVLAKDVPAQVSGQITAMGLPGIYQQGSYARSYPDGNIAANVIGFTGTSNGVIKGGAGLEEQYNAVLAGRAGRERVQVGALSGGQPIPLAGSRDTPVVNGSSLRLTIVTALQYAAEQACAAQVKKTKASNCTIVILQPQTGHVLAMAQWPTFSPAAVTDAGQATDIPVQNVFQPGSTAKVITASAAFERGGQTPMSAYDIPYQIERGGQYIRDAEWGPGERFTIAGIIAHSSNVGMSQVAGHVSEQTQYQYLRAFGLGQPTGIGLPGESQGLLPPVSRWTADTRYTLSFGQGVAVTALQMAEVYATIANDGVRVQPTLVQGITDAAGTYTAAAPPPARRVIQAGTARDLLQILQQVPAIDAEGGQPWGVIPGYAVAAKTGTSQESNGRCALCVYGSSWIGIAPGNAPKLVVAVNVQNPRKGGHFGAIVAGPVFYQVMKDALATLQIPPDGAIPAKVRLTAP
ncbi:MAG: peptidoglycan glycosyltransferase, partial [Actinobacteria bacterium]|nr:peptidoglycan glycosyltransferase [Actinomycetota bacterium]